MIKATIPLPGGETAVYNSTGLNFIRHTDWLGSSRLATTWAHAVYSKEAYAPFGETYNEAGTADRSFTGQDQDTVTGPNAQGVYDFLFRKYDPAAGRWLSPDPSGWKAVNQAYPQSLNRYAYVQNDPMSLTDPNGLECVWDDGSFDSESDPSTGSPGQCQAAGGTWIELGFGGAWSSSENTQYAGWVQGIANYAENGHGSVITTFNPSTGITSFTLYNSSGLVRETGTDGTITQYGYSPGSVSAFFVSSNYNPAAINQIYAAYQESQFAQQDPYGQSLDALIQSVAFDSEHPFGNDLHSSLCGGGEFAAYTLGVGAAPGAGDALGLAGYSVGLAGPIVSAIGCPQ
ncbi:MAG: RHS repeat-associated core domain-containing protein [Terracidiphilus sp.]